MLNQRLKKQKLNLGEHRCMECDEIVTNPICTECLAERMRVAVRESSPRLAKKIRGIPTAGGTSCIFCGRAVGVCAHCFSKDVYEFLQEKDRQLAAVFKSQFDFDLRTKLADFE